MPIDPQTASSHSAEPQGFVGRRKMIGLLARGSRRRSLCAAVRLALACVAGMAIATAASPSRADALQLKTGGRLIGRILNPEEAPRESWQIETLSGGLVALEVHQVTEPVFQSPEELEYERRAAACADTPDDLWKLAEWCRENKLDEERTALLERILQLDTDHADARHALGYSQFRGEWKTQRQAMEEQGYVMYKGRWRLPQEVELLKRKESQNLAEKEWFQKLKILRSRLDGEQGEAARRELLSIDTPDAVPALAQALEEDPRRPARVLYAESLGHINAPSAHAVLAERAMTDPDEEVRLSCLDQLRGKDLPDVVAFFVKRLSSKDNREVNLAGVALRHVHNTSAIHPLIDALVTTHKFQITASPAGSMSTSFNSAGGGGLSMNEKPKIIKRNIPNQAVLDALVAITGMNFSFDAVAWNAWYAAASKRPDFDARRDP